MFDDRSCRRISRMVRTGECASLAELQQALMRSGFPAVSRETVRHVLLESHMRASVMRKKPMLTSGQKKTRLDWAVAHADWTIDQWSRVLFSDETRIARVSARGRHYVWHSVSDPNPLHGIVPTLRFGGGSVSIWACMCSRGLGWACRIVETLDSALYVNILNDEMSWSASWFFGNEPFIFQQDNSSVHTAHVVSQWFDEHKVDVLNWPSQSPDLNPIEHFWAELKRRIARRPIVRNSADLWTQVQLVLDEFWAPSGAAYCLKLVQSMPSRVQAVIRAKGGSHAILTKRLSPG